MKTSTKIVTIVASAAVLAVLAAGGVQVASALNQLGEPVKHSISLGTPTPAATATKTPAATATKAPAAHTVGQVVPDGTILPDGQKAYALPDGTNVVVQKDQPLPAVVTASIQSGLNAIIAANPSESSGGVIGQQAQKLGGMSSVLTGKQVLVIVPIFGTLANESTPHTGWSVISHKGFDTKAEAIAYANSLVAASPAPAEWAVIVAP